MNKIHPQILRVLTAVSLFSGAGGGSLALLYNYFNEQLAIDNWSAAQKAFEANFKDEKHIPFWNADIYSISGNDILRRILMGVGELTLLLLSPPCQGLSVAKGKMNPLDPRNGLFLHSISLIEQILPKIFIIENVPGMNDPRNTSIFNEIKLRIREQLGPHYAIKLFNLNSSFYKTGQERNRYIFIGYALSLGVIPTAPTPDPLSRENLRIIDIDPSITAIKVGQSKKIIKHNTKYMNTITASEPVTIYSGGKEMKMSIEQDKKFASFPDWYQMPIDISKDDAHKLMGNTIPPMLMKNIVEHILSEVGNLL